MGHVLRFINGTGRGSPGLWQVPQGAMMSLRAPDRAERGMGRCKALASDLRIIARTVFGSVEADGGVKSSLKYP